MAQISLFMILFFIGVIMEILLIILASIAGLIILSIAGGYIFYYAYGIKHSKQLSPDEFKICARLVGEHRGYPFLCALVVKNGKCPCLPCKKLERGKFND
jgi:hypothetical protein